MRHTMRTLGTALVTAAALALAGCGDSNLFDSQSDSSGRQADMEQGVAALDAGDWQTARTIFAAMDQSDPEVAKYHASTYLAEAGFNAIELLRELSKASDDADGGHVMYESLTRMFDDGDGVLTSADLFGPDGPDGNGGRLGAIGNALGFLGAGLPNAGRVADRDVPVITNPALTFQAGLYAAVYAVLSVVGQLEDPANPGHLLLSIGELGRSVKSRGDQLPIGNRDGSVPGVLVPDHFNFALGLVYDASFVLDSTVFSGSVQEDGSEVASALAEFLEDLGYLNNLPAADTVDAAELRTYLHGLLPAN